MKFIVQITECIIEVRNVTVEAESPSHAHRLAYEAWVENGESDDGLESLSVNDRTFNVRSPDGTEEEFNDNEFQD